MDGSSGQRIRQESMPFLRDAGINPNDETVAVFCNLGTRDPEGRKMTQKSPCYAFGTQVSGTAWQLDEPILDPKRLKNELLSLDAEYGRITLAIHHWIFIVGVAHEIGHALSLPHNRERADEHAARRTA